jgi:hypothetical protein
MQHDYHLCVISGREVENSLLHEYQKIYNHWHSVWSQTFKEVWMQAFVKKLNEKISEEVKRTPVDHFELWNFESVSMNVSVTREKEQLGITLLTKLKTFLKIGAKTIFSLRDISTFTRLLLPCPPSGPIKRYRNTKNYL